jgi:hypothetical protein
MNTNAFGLIAAIPLLVFHAILSNKANKIIGSIEMAGVKFLNVMTLNRAIQAGIPKEKVQEFNLQENKRIEKELKDNKVKESQLKESQLEKNKLKESTL